MQGKEPPPSTELMTALVGIEPDEPERAVVLEKYAAVATSVRVLSRLYVTVIEIGDDAAPDELNVIDAGVAVTEILSLTLADKFTEVGVATSA